MKTLIQKFVFVLFLTNLMLTIVVNAQDRKKLTVLNIDAQGIKLTPEQLGNLVRIEVEKLDTFEVMDRYDVAYLIDKHKLVITNCYGKICLLETGKTIESQKMLTGSAELYGETIIMTFRLIDVGSGTIEKTIIREYLNLQNEIQMMVRISIEEMFGRATDQITKERLTKKYNYDNTINNPNKSKVNNSGPRMGATFFTGKSAQYIRASKDAGGWDAYPVMFQFGYQFEIQYLNQGNFQALFEIVPLITGLDQNIITPSVTFMNGLRNNRFGLEFAFGPSFNIVSKAKGYYDQNNVWHLESDWNQGAENPYSLINRTDSRGKYTLGSSFIFACGKTFKSGKLNIPVNAYIQPGKDGFNFGISFGYNTRKD